MSLAGAGRRPQSLAVRQSRRQAKSEPNKASRQASAIAARQSPPIGAIRTLSAKRQFRAPSPRDGHPLNALRRLKTHSRTPLSPVQSIFSFRLLICVRLNPARLFSGLRRALFAGFSLFVCFLFATVTLQTYPLANLQSHTLAALQSIFVRITAVPLRAKRAR